MNTCIDTYINTFEKPSAGNYIGNEKIDLRLCLMDSAQSFHWRETKRGFVAVLDGCAVRLWQGEDGLHAQGADRAFLRHYLDLDRDYAAVALEYAHIPAAERAIALYPGLRVLNQSPWDALLSFILSANNNVARIRKLVQALCEELGEAHTIGGTLEGACSETGSGSDMARCEGLAATHDAEAMAGSDTVHGFPSPEVLSGCEEARLRGLGVGYRAPYLIETARRVRDGFPLGELREMDYDEAHRLLTKLPGVGDKVADCVLLFGCGHAEAFPVDVWVEKLMGSWFGLAGCNRRELARIAREKLGSHAGLLQQFLFHAARTGEIEL